MAYGFVYVLGHELMEGVFKIGMTSQTPLKRCDELSSGTAIPSPFDLLFYIEVDEPLAVEREFHDEFDDHRISENREFFRANIIDIHKAFDKYKEEGAPLAMTYTGETYLSLAEEDRRIMSERAASFCNRMVEAKAYDVAPGDDFE